MENQSSFKRTLYRTVEKFSARRNCTTISCSVGEHIETLKLTKKAELVSNGVNISKLQSVLSAISIDKCPGFTVFTLGRICYQKNPALFNQIALSLPEVHFVWIGDGELRKELSASNIEITGWVEREEALKLSAEYDVFILTSLWEGLPISLLEAMYMKKLCIVSNVIGNRDVIRNGENGFICDEVSDYVHAISLAKSHDMSNMTRSAYTDILNHYNTKVMADKYKEIYLSRFTESGQSITTKQNKLIYASASKRD
jgi:glycosyltransferase involved in cell wall biosynthesis